MMRARGVGSCVRVLGVGIEKCGNDIEEVCKGSMNDQRGRLLRCGGGLPLFVSGSLFFLALGLLRYQGVVAD